MFRRTKLLSLGLAMTLFMTQTAWADITIRAGKPGAVPESGADPDGNERGGADPESNTVQNGNRGRTGNAGSFRQLQYKGAGVLKYVRCLERQCHETGARRIFTEYGRTG